jgi:hypothetical protein
LAEWLVEQGIGEDRAILLDGDHVCAARVQWPGALVAGQVEDARLLSKSAGSKRGTVRFTNGEEALVAQLPPDAREGSAIRLKVTRAAMAEAGRLKRAQARPTDEPLRPAPSLLEGLAQEGCKARLVHRFPGPHWDDLMADAFAREIAFAGGSILLAPTPAMTLIDVDGDLDAKALALAAVPAIADALRRLDVGGSVGIDFPTLAAKADRRAVDEALDEALRNWPHERTAMNGFGFVQLVARAQRPSILQLAAFKPAQAAARLLLRRAEGVEQPGAILLRADPQVIAALKGECLEELARRTGRVIRCESDSGLALEAGTAQFVAA